MLAEQFVIISNIDSEIFKGPSNYSTIGYKLFQNCLRQKVQQQLHGSQDAGRQAPSENGQNFPILQPTTRLCK